MSNTNSVNIDVNKVLQELANDNTQLRLEKAVLIVENKELKKALALKTKKGDEENVK